jgi:hypothetical protein
MASSVFINRTPKIKKFCNTQPASPFRTVFNRSTYRQNDEFELALTAGNVHGTATTPPGTTRTVVDTASKITIASDRLTCSGGQAVPAWGDPGFWLDKAITRAAGQVIAFKINVTDVTSKVELGLDADKTGELTVHRVRITADTILYYDGTTAHPICFIPTDGRDYVFVIVLRAAGALFFLKESEGDYIFLGETTTNTDSGYLGVSNYSAAATVDFIRQCNYRYLPAPVLSDSFTGDAGTNDGRLSDGLGHAETTGPGMGGSGVAWSGASGAVDGSGRLAITPTFGDELNSGDIIVGNWYQITATQANFFYTGCAVGNTFRCTTAKTLSADNKVKLMTHATSYNYVDLSSKDIDITCYPSMDTGLQVGIIFGLDATGTYFGRAYHNGAGSVVLEICENGIYTTKATVAKAYSADAPLRVRRHGRNIWVYYNNAIIGTGPTTTLSANESNHLSGTRAGLFSTSALNSFAGVSVRYIGTSSEYSHLNRIISTDYGYNNAQSILGLTWNESTDVYVRTDDLTNFPLGVSPGDNYLPIQKLMRRCVASGPKTIAYFLDPNDSTKKADGTAAVLDGTDGDVMVYVPRFYYKYSCVGTLHSWQISLTQHDGYSVHPAFELNEESHDYRLYSAYEGYKDGSNKLRSISGVLPTVSQIRSTFRGYASSNSGGLEDAYLVGAVQLLYAVEYADFDTQAFIGQGITQYSVWPGGPQALTGNSNSVGNATNSSSASVPAWAATTGKTLGQMVTPTVANGYTYQCTTPGTTDGSQPTWPTTIGATVTDGTVVWTCVRIALYMSYRGIENWYGHIWKFVDGINIHNSSANRSRLYLCNNRGSFADDTDSGYTLIGTLAETDGYFKTLVKTGVGFYPAGVGGGPAIYLADYYYTYFDNDPDIGWRVALRGGDALYGTVAGVFCWNSSYGATLAYSNIGGRLCF